MLVGKGASLKRPSESWLFARVLLVVLILFPVALAVAQPVPKLVITFDHGFDGSGPAGPVAGRAVGAAKLVQGRTGMALLSGPDTGFASYPSSGVLDRHMGTVEMWVCPVDWKPADPEFHVFFQTVGQGALYLYKYYLGVRGLMLTSDKDDGPYYVSSVDLDWTPGSWHHIAGTWSREGVMFFVDGNPANSAPTGGPLPRALGDRFVIGDHPWHLDRHSASLIDDVRVYDRALSPAHIAAHSRGDYDYRAPLDPTGLLFRYDVDPDNRRIQVEMSTRGADVDEQPLRVDLCIVRKGEPFGASGLGSKFENGWLSETLSLPASGPGSYEIVARVSEDSKPLIELRRDLLVPDPTWNGNKIGLAEKVLPPWIPLEIQARTIKCWGRQYDLAPSSLPERIVSSGADILSRPVTITTTFEGRPVKWTDAPMGTVIETPTKASFSGCLDSVGSIKIRFECQTTLHYDGLMTLEIGYSGAPHPPVDSISIDIPIKPDHALYRHHWVPEWLGLAGALPKGSGGVDSMAFIPFYWLGDNDRGLYWFCESGEMWPNAKGKDAIEILRETHEVILRLNILKPGQKLCTPWKFVCGLQATPVKPRPHWWRKWRLDPAHNATIEIIWPDNTSEDMRYYGFPEAADPSLFARRIGKIHHERMMAVPYLCLSYLSTACPEWSFYGKFWAMGSVDTLSSDVAAYGAGFAMVSPLGAGYSDFIIRKNQDFATRFGTDGAYHDNTHIHASDRLEASVGYVRDGERFPTYPILGLRSLYQRSYAMFKEMDRETFSIAHMSGKVAVPILAYDDAYLDGEQFKDVIKDDYMQVLTLDRFRAEFMGRQWGLVPFFIPQLKGRAAEEIEPTRGLMALLMIHDVGIWPIWCNLTVANEALKALDKFGIIDAEFIPYFDPRPPATTTIPDTYVSAYRRADGRALLIAANLGAETRHGDIRVDLERLGIRSGTIESWPDRRPLPLHDDIMTIDIPKHGYALLVVSPQRGVPATERVGSQER